MQKFEIKKIYILQKTINYDVYNKKFEIENTATQVWDVMAYHGA